MDQKCPQKKCTGGLAQVAMRWSSAKTAGPRLTDPGLFQSLYLDISDLLNSFTNVLILSRFVLHKNCIAIKYIEK